MRRVPRIPRATRIRPAAARSLTTQSNGTREMASITTPSKTSEPPRFHFCHLAQNWPGLASARRPQAISATLRTSQVVPRRSNLEKSIRWLAANHNTSAPRSRNTNSISNCVRRAGESMQPRASGNTLDADFHGDRNARTVHCVERGFGDCVGDVLAFDDVAENGVAVIEVRRGCHSDEKLAAVGAWARVGHRKFSGLRMTKAGVKFVGKVVARAAAAVALRTSALNHKVRNHAVKDQAVVIRTLFFLSADGVLEFLGAFSETNKVFNGLRGLFFKQSANDVAHGSFKNCVSSCGSRHVLSFGMYVVCYCYSRKQSKRGEAR